MLNLLPDKNIAVWVAALRSGEYEQGTTMLHPTMLYPTRLNANRFCCLGVMCDICPGVGWDYIESTCEEEEKDIWHVSPTRGLPPNELAVRFGISLDVASVLADRNDEWQWTFNRIADYLLFFVYSFGWDLTRLTWGDRQMLTEVWEENGPPEDLFTISALPKEGYELLD